MPVGTSFHSRAVLIKKDIWWWRVFDGQYIYGQRGSVGMVVLAKYGKSAQTSAL